MRAANCSEVQPGIGAHITLPLSSIREACLRRGFLARSSIEIGGLSPLLHAKPVCCDASSGLVTFEPWDDSEFTLENPDRFSTRQGWQNMSKKAASWSVCILWFCLRFDLSGRMDTPTRNRSLITPLSTTRKRCSAAHPGLQVRRRNGSAGRPSAGEDCQITPTTNDGEDGGNRGCSRAVTAQVASGPPRNRDRDRTVRLGPELPPRSRSEPLDAGVIMKLCDESVGQLFHHEVV
jgi:hypothetical protein